jgi:NDP-sugar pyrophosphorylase family protein
LHFGYLPCSCEIGNGVRLSNCVILNRVQIKNYARVADSILGWSSKGARGSASHPAMVPVMFGGQ